MVIKAVVFDIGKVILNEGGRESRGNLAEIFGFSEEAFSEFAKDKLKLSYIGKLSAEKFFGELREKLSIKASVRDLIEAWKEERIKRTSFDEGVVSIIKSLNGNYVLGSLTDTTVLNDVVREEVGVYDLFDFNVVSTKEGVRKPELGIYKILLKRLEDLGILAEEIVFVDDEIGNLEPAMELGVNTILFEGMNSLEEKLIGLGVEF